MPITEADIDEITARQTHRRAVQEVPRNPEPPPGSFGATMAERQEIARLDRLAAARAAEERLAAERKATAERRRLEREANAPQRAAAAAELAKLEQEMDEAERRADEMADRAAELRRVISR